MRSVLTFLGTGKDSGKKHTDRLSTVRGTLFDEQQIAAAFPSVQNTSEASERGAAINDNGLSRNHSRSYA